MSSCYKISSDYIQYIGNLIINKDEKYFKVLNSLIELYNEEKIDFYALRYIYYQIYKNFLLNKKVKI